MEVSFTRRLLLYEFSVELNYYTYFLNMFRHILLLVLMLLALEENILFIFWYYQAQKVHSGSFASLFYQLFAIPECITTQLQYYQKDNVNCSHERLQQKSYHPRGKHSTESRKIISVTRALSAVDTRRPYFSCSRIYMEKLTNEYNTLVKKKHRLPWNTFVGKNGHAIDMDTCYKHKISSVLHC